MGSKPDEPVGLEGTFGLGFITSNETRTHYVVHIIVVADEQLPEIIYPLVVEIGEASVQKKFGYPAKRVRGMYNPQTQMLTVFVEKQKPD